MQLQRCVSAVKNVKAVVALGALQRIPEPRELYGLTYFSIHDIWLYQEVSDHKTCELCRRYAEHEDYHGNRLRMLFPYLEILDEYTIAANVHPNCRCVLVRYIGEPEKPEEPVVIPKPKEPFYWFNSQGGEFTKEEKVLYVEQMKEIIKELPKQHTEGIDEVVVVSEFPGSPNTAGRYTRHPQYVMVGGHPQLSDEGLEEIQIKLKSLRSEPKWDERIITYHEVGHHVWFTKISDKTHDDWVKFWAANQVEMPTQYAKTNPAEGFAESYAYIQFNPHGVNPGVKKWFSEHKDAFGK